MNLFLSQNANLLIGSQVLTDVALVTPTGWTCRTDGDGLTVVGEPCDSLTRDSRPAQRMARG